MGKKRGSLTPLGDIIANLLGDGGLPFNPEDANIWKVWDEVVGSIISRHASPSWIKEGKLRVKVSDPIWLQELTFMEKAIKDKLNKHLGRPAVERIEFRVGPNHA
ncbi:MAG: DUF721 domain-containing protein [Deltaproteobacteria bacterium]|nr:DUF721 domain-containing protein [Deltaproteobacteria bacterium]